MRPYRLVTLLLALTPLLALAESPTMLAKKAYDPLKSVVLLSINWGRNWGCAGLDNAQIVSLSFMKIPVGTGATFDFNTPSKLMAKRDFIPIAVVVPPGEYALAAFDVLVARSRSETAHVRGTALDLLRKEEALGGSFSVEAGEIVYIGHFGLDCVKEPIPWRYYLQDREEFERYVAQFRKSYEFMNGKPVRFQLFNTAEFGTKFALDNPVVQ